MVHKRRIGEGQATFTRFGGLRQEQLKPEFPRIKQAGQVADLRKKLPDDPAGLVNMVHPGSKADLKTKVEAISRFAALIGKRRFQTKELRSLCMALESNVRASARQKVEGAEKLVAAFRAVTFAVADRKERIEHSPKFRGCPE